MRGRKMFVAAVLVVLLTSADTHTVNQQTSATVYAIVGLDATLPCRSNLSKSVAWQSPGPAFDEIAFGGEVHDPYRNRFSLVESSAGGGRNSLLIRSTRLNDSGEYTCVEDNGIGTSHSVLLVVRDARYEQKTVEDLTLLATKLFLTSLSTTDTPVSNDGRVQEPILPLVVAFVSLIITFFLVVIVILLLIYVYRLRQREARNRTRGAQNGLLNNANNGLDQLDLECTQA